MAFVARVVERDTKFTSAGAGALGWRKAASMACPIPIDRSLRVVRALAVHRTPPVV
jgi:hypothetical protein